MGEKVVHNGSCYVTITHNGKTENLGTNNQAEWAERKITVTEGGQTIIERPGTGRTTIAPAGAKVEISK
jgi:malate/lactate dehydrogenase